MKVRKVISLLMLTLYMAAVGVPCMASITCHCAAHDETAVLCRHCHHDDCSGSGEHLDNADDCSCGHSHNLEKRLYTADHGTDHDALRRVNLIISAAAEPVVPLCVETAPVCRLCRTRHTRDALLPDAPEIAASALRAPPAVA